MKSRKHAPALRCGSQVDHEAFARQRGFSLFVVLVMLLLSALLAVGGARVAGLMESVAGNETEYQRAFDAAEAALLDAERDIRGLAFDTATKKYVKCSVVANAACRAAPTDRVLPDPDTGATAYVEDGLNSCAQGICYFAARESAAAAAGSEAYQFWTRSAYKKAFARYGQYTSAPTGGSTALSSAKYWIEVIFRGSNTTPLYRVTAMAEGARRESVTGGTRVVLQMSVDPDPVTAVK